MKTYKLTRRKGCSTRFIFLEKVRTIHDPENIVTQHIYRLLRKIRDIDYCEYIIIDKEGL